MFDLRRPNQIYITYTRVGAQFMSKGEPYLFDLICNNQTSDVLVITCKVLLLLDIILFFVRFCQLQRQNKNCTKYFPVYRQWHSLVVTVSDWQALGTGFESRYTINTIQLLYCKINFFGGKK